MNPASGDLEKKIGSRTYKFRPGFKAISLFENMARKGIVRVLNDCHEGMPAVNDVVVALYAAMLSYDPKSMITLDELGEDVVKQGLTECALIVYGLFGSVMSGEGETKKKEDPVTPTP